MLSTILLEGTGSTYGKSTKGKNDWKGGIEVLKVAIILTEVLIQVKGKGMPKRDGGN